MTQAASKVVFDKRQVQGAVARLAKEVSTWLKGSQTTGLNLICVLEGARPFARDLTAALQKEYPGLDLRTHDVRVQGTDGTQLLEDRRFRSPFPTFESLGPHPLLVVDDLVDSGLTLKLLKRQFESLTTAPIKTAVLIRKFGEDSGPVDFKGFDLGLDLRELAAKGLRDYWLYGYGMDLDGKQRDLDHIGWVGVK